MKNTQDKLYQDLRGSMVQYDTITPGQLEAASNGMASLIICIFSKWMDIAQRLRLCRLLRKGRRSEILRKLLGNTKRRQIMKGFEKNLPMIKNRRLHDAT